MNIAVLGTGFGAYHTELYAKMPDVDRIIVWGRNPEKLKELQSKFHVAVTEDMEDIWKDRQIDLADICLPNHLHREIGIKALQSGKNIFIETPVAESEEDAAMILETARKCGKRAFADLFLRFEYPYQYLYELTKSNKYGRLKELLVKRETPPWWGNLDISHIGLNFMIHDVDFVVSILGKPDSILANGIAVRKDQSLVMTRFSYKDAAAWIRGASAMPGKYPFSVGYEAVFEGAAVRYYEDGFDGQIDTKLEVFCNEKKEEIPLPQANCYEKALSHVLKCVKTNESSCLDIEEAVNTLETVLRMNRELVPMMQ